MGVTRPPDRRRPTTRLFDYPTIRPFRPLRPLRPFRPLRLPPRLAPPLALVSALGLVYLTTLAPGLTWANRGADGGDLITAAATSGVAHPPGYPTYLALARLFQLLPLGSLAFRTNLLSAVCTVLAAFLVCDLVARHHAGAARFGRAAGVIAGFGFGLSPLLWSQAVITEVYALHALFVALILRLMPLAGSRESGFLEDAWLDRIGGLVLGLALGNHLTVALLLPPWLLVGALRTHPRTSPSRHPGTPAPRFQWRSLARRLAWLSLGLLIYLILPLRARAGSPVNWGNPTSWEGFWWLISGQVYQRRVFSLPVVYLFPRVQAWAGLLLAQFGLPGLVVGLYGLFFGRPASSRLFWVTGWMVIAFSIFAIGYNAYDSYAYLIPAFLAFAIWFGLGVAAALEAVDRRAAWLAPMTAVLFVLILLANAGLSLPEVDASRDLRAEAFGRTALAVAPADALLFAHGDEETFTLWYFHFALQERPDVAVLNEPLLVFKWYRDSLRTTYPGLVVPEGAPASWRGAIVEANPRPVCETHLDEHEVLACLP